jgi:uncharacterized protein YciI
MQQSCTVRSYDYVTSATLRYHNLPLFPRKLLKHSKIFPIAQLVKSIMSVNRLMYIIHCIDDPTCGLEERGIRFGGSVKRLSVYTEHRAYQGETSDPNSSKFIRKIAAGPMESDCGKYMIGSCFIVEATKEEATRFNQEDPFFAAKVWGQITISRWVSIPNGIKPVSAHKDGDDMTSLRMICHL